MRSQLRALFLVPFLAAGCGGSDPAGHGGEGPKPPATDYLLVEAEDGMVLVGEVPRISIVEGERGDVQIEVHGEATDDAGTRLWYLYGRLTPEDLLDGYVINYAVLGTSATIPGLVNVMIETPIGGELEVARAGTASMQRFDGWFMGQIVNDDPRMAAAFKGGYQVTCSYLSPDGANRIVDDAFESEFCSAFASVLPPEPGTAP